MEKFRFIKALSLFFTLISSSLYAEQFVILDQDLEPHRNFFSVLSRLSEAKSQLAFPQNIIDDELSLKRNGPRPVTRIVGVREIPDVGMYHYARPKPPADVMYMPDRINPDRRRKPQEKPKVVQCPLGTKVHHDPARLARAEEEAARLSQTIRNLEREANDIISALRAKSKGGVEQFLQSRVSHLNSENSAISEQTSVENVKEAVEEILARFDRAQQGIKFCDETENAYTIIDIESDLTSSRWIRLHNHLTKDQLDRISQFRSQLVQGQKSISTHILEGVEPQPISQWALNKLGSSIDKISARQKDNWPAVGAALICRGVLTADCFLAFLQNFSGKPTEKDLETLLIALDRATLDVKQRFLLDISAAREKEPEKIPSEVVIWISDRVKKDIQLATPESLLSSLRESTAGADLEVARILFEEGMKSEGSRPSKFQGSLREDALVQMKVLLKEKLNPDIFNSVAPYVSPQESEYFLETFIQMKSKDQLRSVVALYHLFNRWAGYKNGEKTRQINNAKIFDALAQLDSKNPERSSQLRAAALSIHDHTTSDFRSTSKEQKERIAHLLEKIRRSTSLLPASSIEQRLLVTSLARLQIRAFKNLDGALKTLEHYPGPALNDPEAPSDLEQIFGEIVAAMVANDRGLSNANTSFLDFSEKHFMPAQKLNELQPELVGVSEFHDQFRTYLGSALAEERSFISARLAMLKALAEKWAIEYSAWPEKVLGPLVEAWEQTQ